MERVSGPNSDYLNVIEEEKCNPQDLVNCISYSTFMSKVIRSPETEEFCQDPRIRPYTMSQVTEKFDTWELKKGCEVARWLPYVPG